MAEVRSWPEVVGQKGEIVAQQIRAQGYTVFVIPEGSPVTMDYRLDRVRIYVNAAGNVVDVPRTA